MDLSAQFPHTFVQTKQPQSAPTPLFGIETDSVILDCHRYGAGAAAKTKANLACCRMPSAIGQSFLDNPVDTCPMGIWQIVEIPIDLNLYLDSSTPREFPSLPFQGRREPQLIKNGWT